MCAVKDVRFGLAGYGLWGAHHTAMIEKVPGAHLTAIADSVLDSREAVAAAHPDAAICSDVHELIEREDVDVVDIVLPNHLHFDFGKAALEAGKHLLIEKPMALVADQCDELIELAQSRKRVLAVVHQLRLSSLWGKVKEMIDGGSIGRPQYVLIELSRFPFRRGVDGWRYDSSRVGDWLLEETVHLFDLARWFLDGIGEPVSVYARGNSIQPGNDSLYDNLSAIVDFPGGAYGVITQTLSAFEHHVNCRITGTDGALSAYWGGVDTRAPQPTYGLRHLCGEVLEDVPVTKSTGEVIELEENIAAMVHCVNEDKIPPATGVDGKWAVALCAAAMKSVAVGHAVNIGG